MLYSSAAMRARLRHSLSTLAALVALAAPRVAWADRVAVLTFGEGDARAQSATLAAVVAGKHEVVQGAELARALGAVRDGQPDTAAEYQALGRAASAAWTVRGSSQARGDGYRVELEVCQVASGRVESLARDIDGTREVAQIGEMLALLVRAEGLGAGKVPWEGGPPAAPRREPPPPPPPSEPPAAPPPPPAPPPAYAEGHPLLVGVTAGGLAAAARPSAAVGSSASLYLGALAAYHLDLGLELRASVAGAVAGPSALTLDAGARYPLPLAPRARLFLVPDLGLGAFVLLGAQKEARLLVRVGVAASLGLGDRVTLEAGPELSGVPGGGGLLLAGGTLKAGARF